MLIVGSAVGLREHLRWFDARPLFGKRVLVTRSREQAGELVELLEELGAEAIEAPSIRIAPPAEFGPLDSACATAGRYDWIVFTSANGVDWFMRRLLAGPARRPQPEGAPPLRHRPGHGRPPRPLGHQGGPDAGGVPRRGDHRRDCARRSSCADGGVLLPRADIAREVLAEELRKAGAEVTEVAVYRTIREPLVVDGDRDIYKMLLDGEIDVVMFTSASTVRNFAQSLGHDQAADLLQGHGRCLHRSGHRRGGAAAEHPNDGGAEGLHGARARRRGRGALRQSRRRDQRIRDQWLLH